jgi:hypothetical protein
VIKHVYSIYIAGAFTAFALLGSTSALALSSVTFVSGKGANSGNCTSPSTPCRTFQFALGQTGPGGEIKVLDPASYGNLTISKSISITGIEGASINRTSGDAIIINAGPSDTVNLSHLDIDGRTFANNGIVVNSVGSLTVAHCTVRSFKFAGLVARPSSQTKLLLTDVTLSDNANWGLLALPQGAGAAHGVLDQVAMNRNGNGLIASGSTAVFLAVDSSAANNAQGFGAGAGAILRLAHSSVTGNSTGVRVVNGAIAESLGDNFIAGNGIDVDGTLTPVPPQ